jgi:nitric oxide synthase oxygenase domain/subunit
VKVVRITKIAGLSLAGFAVAAVAADKINVGPVASQLAGFAGAFIGTLVARRRARAEDRSTAQTREEPPR